jgi:hypothetical protein
MLTQIASPQVKLGTSPGIAPEVTYRADAVFTSFYQVSWEEALREFHLHKQATSAPKTVRYYDAQLRQLILWANAEGIAFTAFGKRHMDRYTNYRIAQGKSRLTLRHDGVCAKKFFDRCSRNDLLDRSLLAEYEVHNAIKSHKHMPTDEEVWLLLYAIPDYWDADKNQGVKSMSGAAHVFHRYMGTMYSI